MFPATVVSITSSYSIQQGMGVRIDAEDDLGDRPASWSDVASAALAAWFCGAGITMVLAYHRTRVDTKEVERIL